MRWNNMPIRQKLMAVILLTSGSVLLLTCAAFIAYEVITLHTGMIEGYTTRAQIIAANSTGSLAFSNEDDATEVLAALKTDRRILEACLYTDQGTVFAVYPPGTPVGQFPPRPGESGYRQGYLEIVCPVLQGDRNLGTVYLRSDLSALTDRYRAYAWLAGAIITASFLLAYLLSRMLQKQISMPILVLAETAQAISKNRDSSVRAKKFGEDELGLLTDAFNQMLTEIQTQDRALKASEANYREIFDKANDAIFIHEIETGRVLDVNQRACDMTGYSREELMGDFPDISSGNPGYTDQDAARWIQKAIAGGPQLFEWQGRHKDGGIHWIEVSLKKAVIAGKERLLAFFREIGDRKKAEELLKNQDFLNAVLENIPNMIFVKDAKELRFVRFNKAGEELLGFSRQDLLGKNDFDFFPREQADFFTSKDRGVLNGGKLTDIPEEPIETKNKGKRILHTKKIPIRDKDGEPQYLLGISEDITEQISAQKEIKEKTQLLDSVLKNIGDGVIVADEKAEFLIFNPAAEKIIGRGAVEGGSGQWVEKFGVFLSDGVTPFPEKELPLVKAIKGEATNNVEQFLRNAGNPDGVYISVSGRPLKDEKGEIHGGVVIVRDVTEQKRQDQMKIYTQALETSNKEMQDFVFVASHDLQEPLRKVQSFGEFLKEEYGKSLDETGRDYLERMRSAASRMQTLINDLLSLTRVTTKAQPFTPIDLSLVLRDVIADLEVRIQEKGAKVEVGRLPTLEADATQMRQLFQNLIGNALKFQRSGVAPVVSIKTETATASRGTSNGKCVIKVEDNGIGFENKYSEQIFKVFERLHGRDEYEGTGIGLAVCRKVVERHGGTLKAESVPGTGSTFIITLPLKQNR